jgi:diguanylate cyclase (GGDEF)-like protein
VIADTREQGLHGDLLSGVSPSGDTDIAVGDILRDVRRLRQITRLEVYLGILASLPFYHFVSGFSVPQLLVVVVVGFVGGTIAIEGVFAQIFKLRKRRGYPGAVSLYLGALPTFDAACQVMVATMRELLRVRGSFLTLQEDGGFLKLIALSDVTRADADRYMRAGATCVQRALASKLPVSLRSGDGIAPETVVPAGQRIVFVPVRSLQKVTGVLALLGSDSDTDLRDDDLLASLGIAVGVSLESLRQRDELRTLAAVDDLTSVYNRRYFFDQLDREIATARRHNLPVSILILDLDGLKDVNDNFGHGAGDEALRTLAQRLVLHSRDSDMVARLGGDEFAVILPRADCVGAAEIAQRLQVLVEQDALTSVPSIELRIAVSCGFASFPEDADDAEKLLRHADGRMYAAKAARAHKRPE